MLRSLHLCLCGKPHTFRLHTQSLVLFNEPIINFFKCISYLPFWKKQLCLTWCLECRFLMALVMSWMFLAALQEPITSKHTKENLPGVPRCSLWFGSWKRRSFSYERQSVVQSSLQALVLYLTVTAYFAYSYSIFVVLLLYVAFVKFYSSFHIKSHTFVILYHLFGHWPTALCA